MTDDTEFVSLGGVCFESDIGWNKGIDLHPNDDNLAEVPFKNFFPRTKGHAKLIDEYHSSRNYPYHSSIKHERYFYINQTMLVRII